MENTPISVKEQTHVAGEREGVRGKRVGEREERVQRAKAKNNQQSKICGTPTHINNEIVVPQHTQAHIYLFASMD